MKKVVLASLLLLGISDAFGATIEKGGVSIKYERCLEYRTIRFDWPYCIKITNRSSKPIVVGPSIISAPLVAYQQIAKALRNEYKFGAMLTALGTAGAGYLHSSMRKRKKPGVHATDFSQLNKTSIVVGGFVTAYLLYKLIKETQKELEAKLEKEALHSPITIQPGQSVEKFFWLKNPNDRFVIDFDTVKVLK